MTAYAVVRTNELFVTVINKSHGDKARDLDTALEVKTPLDQPGVMYLAAPHNEVAATKDVTLGGAAISSRNGWNGQWTPLKLSQAGQCTLRVPAASAAIVRARLSAPLTH